MGSVYGLVGLLLAAAVHASTFAPVTLSPEHPLFRLLHIGIFPLFIPMVWRLRAWSEQRRGLFGFPATRLRWRELLSYLPPWAIGIAALLFVHAAVNFMSAMPHLSAGGAGGRGVITPEQARYTVRAFSGHWMIFHAIPTFFFLFVPASARHEDSRQAAVQRIAAADKREISGGAAV